VTELTARRASRALHELAESLDETTSRRMLEDVLADVERLPHDLEATPEKW
jgi:hypothetical protein